MFASILLQNQWDDLCQLVGCNAFNIVLGVFVYSIDRRST
jgi:hypothetical protein